MSGRGEFWIGLTDLPIFVGAFVFSFLIREKGGSDKNRWSLEYIIIATGALLGSIVHCIEMTPATDKTVWIILYVFLYALVWLFFSLMYESLKGKAPHKAWFWSGVACYAVSCLVKVFIGHGDIYSFEIYSFLLAAVLMVECIRQGRDASREKLVMSLLSLAIVMQGTKPFLGSVGVVSAHILVLSAMLSLYKVAKKQSRG